MAGCYGHPDARSSHTRCHAPPATNTQGHHEPSTSMRYTGAGVSLNTYSPVPTPSIQGPAYQYLRGSYPASPYQSSSHHTEAGIEYLPQQQTEPRSSTGSERISWQAETQSFAAATSSRSTSSDHWNLRHPQMMDSSHEQPCSPVPFTIDRLGAPQHRSNEAGPRPSVMQNSQSNSFWDPRDGCVDPARLQLSDQFYSREGAEPWSSLNSRYRVSEHVFTDQWQEAIPCGPGDLRSVPTTPLSGIYGASVSSERQNMSKEAFDFDVENIMDGVPTSHGFESKEQPPQQVSYGIDPYGNDFPSNGVAFQYRLDRAETPFDAGMDVESGQRDSRLV